MHITLPPYARCTIRTSGPFSVARDEGLIGPDSADSRVFTYETANDPVDLQVICDDDTLVTHDVQVRPSRYESNSGVPVMVQEPVNEPTIQEMIRMYLAQAVDKQTNEVETPEEFFDFGLDGDDEQDLLTSPWEYDAEVMEEQYAPDDNQSPPESDSTESRTLQETTETPEKETEPEKA